MGEYNISGDSPEEIKTRIMNLNNMRECQENTLKQMEAEVAVSPWVSRWHGVRHGRTEKDRDRRKSQGA